MAAQGARAKAEEERQKKSQPSVPDPAAVSTGTSAKAAGIAANGEKETQTTEQYGPQLPEGLRHDPEMDGQFVDSFIQARLRGPQAFAAWVDTLPLPGSGAKETAAAPLFAQTNGGDVQPVETVDGQGDAAQEPDEVGLVEAALDRVEGANAEAETEENGPTPALTEEPTEEPMPQPTPGPTPEPTPGPTEEPTEEPRPQPMPGPTPGPTPEPEQGTQTESTEEPTPELAAEQPLEESATLQQATPALEDGVSAAEQETEPDDAAEEIDLWSANTDYVAGIDTQLKEIRERIAAIDGELAEGPNEALSAEREQLVESQKQLRSDRARGVGKWTVAEELVQSIQEQWETLQAQFDAGDYRAFIEDEELWDAVKDDPESAKYAAQTELGRRQKELNLQSTVVLAHQPHDDETRFYRSTADSSWLKMLYDREIALQSGDTARVQEINAAMDAAGFEKKWPEEVAAEKRLQEEMIAYQREQGDEVTRQKLGYAADRKLTDEDYLRAAQIDGDFTMFNLWHDPKAIADFFSLSGDVNLFEEIGKNGIFGGLFSYTEKSKEGYEDRLNQAVQIIIGDGASYAQTKNAKDILSVVPSVSGGAIQGVLSIADALPFVITEMYYQVNKNRLGTEESWEQMRMDDWFFNVMCMVRDFSSDVMDSMDVDVSARSKWVGMAEGVSYTVAQNLRIYELSRGVANLLVSNFAHTIPQAGKLFTTVRLVTQDVGFWMTGYKSCVQEALVAGATQEEAFWYGVVGASISAAVERIDDLGGRYWGSADSATQGLMKYFEGRGEKWKWVESMADSFLGERVESRIEDPLQALAQKILYDPDKPWYGKDGVFDPERSNEAARISGIGGLILGGLGGISARRAQIQAQGGVDVETGNPNTKAIESAAKAAAALGDENSSQKTQNIATKVLDSVTENGDAPEYMMKALEDARTEDIAAKATGGKAAKSREELGKAQDGLKEKIGKRSIAEANVQKQEQWLLGMKKALKENPTPENLKAYQKAQADHRAAQQQLERAQQEVIAQQRAVNG
ncbi:hypothetical protein [Beduinella massiliensis]|uniref:hypothetical protein n=1 Tax=Beduinella massiliensis TaxID=1852363 RepID=UPI0031F7EF65